MPRLSDCTPSLMTWFTATSQLELAFSITNCFLNYFSVTSKKHCIIQNRNWTNSNNYQWKTRIPVVSIFVGCWRKLWAISWNFNSFNSFVFGKSFKIFHFDFKINCEALWAKWTQEFWSKTSKTVEEKALTKTKYNKK